MVRVRRILSQTTIPLLTASLLFGLVAERFLLDSRVADALALSLFGVSALLALLTLIPRESKEAPSSPVSRPPVHLVQRIAGILLALAGGGLLGLAGWRTYGSWPAIREMWQIYLAGTGLALAGFALWDGYRPIDAFRRWMKWLKINWLEAVLFALVIALGFIVTLAGLHDYPPAGGISWSDEAQMGMAGYGILHHGMLPWQFSTSNYPVALAFQLLGNTTFALRLPFALMGALVLVPFYYLARRMTGPMPALAATYLFAVARYRIAFVRLVLPLTPDMLMIVIALALLARAVHTRGKAPYFLAGVALSLGMPSHASFKVAPLFVLTLLGMAAVSGIRAARRRPPDQRWQTWRGMLATHLPGILVFIVAFAFFVAPYAGVVVREPNLAIRERFVSIMPAIFNTNAAEEAPQLSWDSVAPRLKRISLFFNQKGETWPAANLPGLPALDEVTGVLFVLGLVTCAIFFWRGWNLLAVVWFLVPVIGGGVLTRDYRSHRFAIAMPAIYLLVGLFIHHAWNRYRRAAPKWSAPFIIVLCLLLLVAGWLNLGTFFGRQVHDVRVRMEFAREISSVATTVNAFEGRRYTYLFANFPFYNPGQDFAWMAGEPAGRRGMNLASVLPVRDTIDQDICYIFSPPYNRVDLAESVQSVYPTAEVLELTEPNGKYHYFVVTVDDDAVDSLQGVTARYWIGGQPADAPDVTLTEPGVNVTWEADESPVTLPFTVEWSGMLYIPSYGSYRLWSDADIDLDIHLDGQALPEGAVMLAEGWHQFSAAGVVKQLPASVQLFWHTPYGTREVIPAHAFSTVTNMQGILATYYVPDGEPAGTDPVWQRIESLIALQGVPSEWQRAPLPALAGKTYRVVYDGVIFTEQAGVYEFSADAQAGSVSLIVDDTEVIAADGVNWRSVVTDGDISLGTGEHALRLEYQFELGEFSGVHLYWMPPAGERMLVPMEAFVHVSDRPLVAAPAPPPDLPAPSSDPVNEAPAEAVVEQSDATESPLQLVAVAGNDGPAREHLQEPWAIAGLSDGRILVADTGNGRLVSFDAMGNFDRVWAHEDLTEPYDVVVGADDTVYLLDSSRCRIDLFDPSGRHLRTIGEQAGLYSPRRMAVDEDGTLYIVDTGGNRVVVLSSSGNVIKQVGRQGSGVLEFDQPGNLALDSAGNLYVLDTVHNRRLLRLDSSLRPSDEWKLNWTSKFVTPGISYAPAEDVFYLTDPDRGHIYQMSSTGETLSIWQDTDFGSRPPRRPTDVYVDEMEGRLYVADSSQNVILIYSMTP